MSNQKIVIQDLVGKRNNPPSKPDLLPIDSVIEFHLGNCRIDISIDGDSLKVYKLANGIGIGTDTLIISPESSNKIDVR